MQTFIFLFDNNKNEVKEYLNKVEYSQIGHKQEDCIGYCIFTNSRQFFEVSSAKNPNIPNTKNIADLFLYCI